MSEGVGILDRLRKQWVDNSIPPKPLLLLPAQKIWAEFDAAMIGNPEPIQEPEIDYASHRNRYLLNEGIRLNHVGFSRLNNEHNPKQVHAEAYAVFHSKSGQEMPLTMKDVDSLDLFIFNPDNTPGADAKYIEDLKSDLVKAGDQMVAGLDTMVELGYAEQNPY